MKKEKQENVKNSIPNFYQRNIHIFTNIIMMTWSIVYHSWLGFVFLIWSNIAWLRADHRTRILRSSPELVSYSMSLLIISYLFSMNFNDRELPTIVYGFKLSQVGLEKSLRYPGVHLIFKTLLSLQFLLTLRLRCQEKHRKEPKIMTTVLEMLSQKQKTPDDVSTSNRIMNTLKKIAVYAWMWMIILLLFTISIYGHQKISLFKMINIMFCLTFVITLQISIKVWMKFNYIFWSTLITNSIVDLVVVYVFQFDDFPQFGFERIIGLEKYQTGTLFIKLFSYTIIIILTGIQINFFHKPLMNFLKVSKNCLDIDDRDEDYEKTVNFCF